jgi:phosphoserine phosphatase RsbU/P
MKDSPELRAAIRATSAFRDFSDANIALLIDAAELEAFEPGAILMVQGEPSDYAMLILEGEVTVTADSARGAIPISTLQAPSLLGELGSLAKLPRSATGRAHTRVIALRFGRAALTEVARATPSLLIDIIGRMGERMRKVNGAISLYTEALGALEQREFDPALLEELRNPIPDLSDFGQIFGRMAEQIILRRQRDDEMASAAVIQRALLPKVPAFAAESGLDIFAAMTPAEDVGGDFYDLVQLADGRVALGVGDVCGKGVPAALFMGITGTLIRIHLRESPDLPGAIVKTNAYLVNNNAAQLFATLVYAAFDPRSGEVEYCSCGHLPALIRRADGAIEKLPAGGLPVGIFEKMKANVGLTAIKPGELLFLHTDGVTDAEDAGHNDFGEDRLHALLAGGAAADASHCVACVDAAVREFAGGAPVRRYHLPRAPKVGDASGELERTEPWILSQCTMGRSR